ncbi:hypothetical protein [Peribacillus simplex]
MLNKETIERVFADAKDLRGLKIDAGCLLKVQEWLRPNLLF